MAIIKERWSCVAIFYFLAFMGLHGIWIPPNKYLCKSNSFGTTSAVSPTYWPLLFFSFLDIGRGITFRTFTGGNVDATGTVSGYLCPLECHCLLGMFFIILGMACLGILEGWDRINPQSQEEAEGVRWKSSSLIQVMPGEMLRDLWKFCRQRSDLRISFQLINMQCNKYISNKIWGVINAFQS